MRYKEYVDRLYYRVIGKYPEKKLQPIGMCIERKNIPSHPYVWCERFPPTTSNELMSIPFDPEEANVQTIQFQPCTKDEIEKIFGDIFFDDYVQDLPINEVTQATEDGYYFDMKRN